MTGLTIPEPVESKDRVLLIDGWNGAYSDDQLRHRLFGVIGPSTGPLTIIFSSASPPPKMEQEPKAVLALRPRQRMSYHCYSDLPTGLFKVPGLLLPEDEAHDVVLRKLKYHSDLPKFSAELTKELVKISGGHVGALVSLVECIIQVETLPPYLILFSYCIIFTEWYGRRETKRRRIRGRKSL